MATYMGYGTEITWVDPITLTPYKLNAKISVPNELFEHYNPEKVESQKMKLFLVAAYNRETGAIVLAPTAVVADSEKNATVLAGRKLGIDLDLSKVVIRPF